MEGKGGREGERGREEGGREEGGRELSDVPPCSYKDARTIRLGPHPDDLI